MNGLLIRVGIDSSKESGKWNAPCGEKDRCFCYVPIREHFKNRPSRGPRFEKFYKEFKPYARALGVDWPRYLTDDTHCHLDPDFSYLTYGDQGGRGKRIREILAPGDFVVFWAGLRLVESGNIICAIIGYYDVLSIDYAEKIKKHQWDCNAHTRRIPTPDDIVVFAKRNQFSGRLRKYIKIGEYREGAQRVDKKLLEEWGPKALCKKDGNEIKNGYIQRSGALPSFGQPDKFKKWFKDQKPKLIHANNI